LDIPSYQSQTQHSSPSTQVFFANSRALPIALSFSYGAQPIISLLLQHRHRIRELHLFHPLPEGLDSFPGFSKNLICLSLVSLRTWDLSALTCPHLIIRDIDYPEKTCLHWESITVLHLSGLWEYHCVDLLRSCVHLVEYRAQEPRRPYIEDTLRSSPFTLPYLKTLEYPVDNDSHPDNIMLRNIHIPVLETLVWNQEDSQERPPDSSRIKFFSGLPSTVRTLHFCNVRCYDEEMSTVYDLIIGYCYDFTLHPILRVLSFDGGDQPTLPKLEKITLYGQEVTDRPVPFDGVDFNALLQVLESRLSFRARMYPQRPLCLEINILSDLVDWPSMFKEGLEGLVKRGLKLGITGTSLID
jgi:hypothetical protein